MTDDETLLRAKLNLETAPLEWQALLRHFAAGNVIAVDAALDLVEVALRMSTNDSTQVGHWIADGSVARVSDAQAKAWLDQDATLWTIVVKPWVLVQERRSTA